MEPVRSEPCLTLAPATVAILRTQSKAQCGLLRALIAEGLDVLTISRRLGHGSPAMTLDVYGHLIKSNDRAAAIIEMALAATEEE
jgi:integrase